MKKTCLVSGSLSRIWISSRKLTATSSPDSFIYSIGIKMTHITSSLLNKCLSGFDKVIHYKTFCKKLLEFLNWCMK